MMLVWGFSLNQVGVGDSRSAIVEGTEGFVRSLCALLCPVSLPLQPSVTGVSSLLGWTHWPCHLAPASSGASVHKPNSLRGSGCRIQHLASKLRTKFSPRFWLQPKAERRGRDRGRAVVWWNEFCQQNVERRVCKPRHHCPPAKALLLFPHGQYSASSLWFS